MEHSEYPIKDYALIGNCETRPVSASGWKLSIRQSRVRSGSAKYQRKTSGMNARFRRVTVQVSA